MNYCYMIIYSHENGYAMFYIERDKKIAYNQDIKEIEWEIYKAKGRNIHPHILDYRLVNTKPTKEKTIDTMEAEDYMRYLKKIVENWNKKGAKNNEVMGL